MSQRPLLLAVLFTAAVATTWLLHRLGEETPAGPAATYHAPDYYMEDFTTLTMHTDGTPRNRLHAVYMAHYPDDDTTELLKPSLEIYRDDKRPLHLAAERGWVTSGNDVVLLRGDVRLWEENPEGERTLEVNTSEIRVLINDEYAETDKPATIVSSRVTVRGTGMRAWLDQNRLEILNHERTVIEASPRS